MLNIIRRIALWLTLATFAAQPVLVEAQGLDPRAGFAVQQALQAKAAVRTMPEFLLAACNAPARVKAKADYVSACDNHDEVLIATALAACPALPQTIRSATYVTGGVTCYLQLSQGKFNLADTVTVTAGSVVKIKGVGVSSWRPIDTVGSQYEGGTLLYSSAPSGKALAFPQFTGVRSDTGATNTIPASGVTLEDFEIRVFNPATTQSVAALTLDGMTTGIIRNVNVFGDLTTNTQPRISMGVSIQAGARSDRKTLAGVHSFFFRDSAFNINTTHLDGSQLVGGAISGGTSPAAFQITANQNLRLFNLHAFSSGIGIKVSGGEPLNIDSVMFESITTPVLVQDHTNSLSNRIGTVFLNSDVPWTGDITNFVQVGWLGGTKAGSGTAATIRKIRNSGTATITAGQTSVVIPHQLIAAPLSYRAWPLGGGSTVLSVTVDATNETVSIPSALGSDLIVGWSATATIGD